MRDIVVRHGCPLGTLCADLGNREDGLGREAGRLMGVLLDWCEGQFRELRTEDPRGQAVGLLAGIQGAAVLASAMRDPELLSGHVRRLQEWVGSVE